MNAIIAPVTLQQDVGILKARIHVHVLLALSCQAVLGQRVSVGKFYDSF